MVFRTFLGRQARYADESATAEKNMLVRVYCWADHTHICLRCKDVNFEDMHRHHRYVKNIEILTLSRDFSTRKRDTGTKLLDRVMLLRVLLVLGTQAWGSPQHREGLTFDNVEWVLSEIHAKSRI